MALGGALAFAATAATCVIFTGGNPANDRRVQTGQGLNADVYVRPDGKFEGELLSADDSGIHLLLTHTLPPHIVFVPARAVRSVKVKPWVVPEDFPPDEEGWVALRGAARFSHSIPAPALAALLRHTGRAAVDTYVVVAPEDEFLQAAKNGTRRYRSAAAAAADGFKRVGTEFPFMGEHWVNLPRVLDDRFDPATPSVLIYVNVGGERVLAGVGYTALLGAVEAPPRSAAPASAWHEHNGSVVEESLPIHGEGHDGDRIVATGDSLRLAVLHAWVWERNPAGTFVTDNRALPLLRAGRTATADDASLLGLTLAQDSARYYAQTVRTALGATDDQARLIDSVVASHRLMAARADNAALASVWQSMWRDLARALPGHRDALAQLRSRFGA